MALIVIGGHARNVGKTSVGTAIVAAWPQYQWTAVKISSHWHEEEKNAADENAGNICRIDEELLSSGTDTGRYIAAGAARAFWVRVRQGRMQKAFPQLMPVLSSSSHVIIESNGIVRYVQPDLYLMVVRCGVADFKESALETLPLAHAVVSVGCSDAAVARKSLPDNVASDVPIFPAPDPSKLTPELTEFIETVQGSSFKVQRSGF